MASVDERVKQIIVEQLGVDEGEVTATASFVDDLGADSLDTVELVMAFEEAFGIEIPEKKWLLFSPLHAELLIEIAIVHLATPTNAEGIATHEASDRSRIEGFDQQFHVGVQFSTVFQPGSKAPDWHICDGVKPMEIDIEMLL